MDALMTRGQFARMATRAAAATILAWHLPLVTAFKGSDIVTDRRQAAIMASAMNETGSFTVFDEYTYANTPYERIAAVFGSSAPSAAQVAEWKRWGQQRFDVAFFNWVYDDANRPPGYRLGNTQPGDGHRYRGMGPGALTGRGNYAWMQKETGIPLLDDPDSIKRPEIGARLMTHFWVKNGLNPVVDGGDQAGFLFAMRKLNGGLHDFSAHLQYWAIATAVLANDDIPDVVPEVISLEARRAQIRRTQARLTELGFDTGGIDGIWGPKSARGLSGFEARHGLKPDGIIDDQVVELLGLKAAA